MVRVRLCLSAQGYLMIRDTSVKQLSHLQTTVCARLLLTGGSVRYLWIPAALDQRAKPSFVGVQSIVGQDELQFVHQTFLRFSLVPCPRSECTVNPSVTSLSFAVLEPSAVGCMPSNASPACGRVAHWWTTARGPRTTLRWAISLASP